MYAYKLKLLGGILLFPVMKKYTQITFFLLFGIEYN